MNFCPRCKEGEMQESIKKLWVCRNCKTELSESNLRQERELIDAQEKVERIVSTMTIVQREKFGVWLYFNKHKRFSVVEKQPHVFLNYFAQYQEEKFKQVNDRKQIRMKQKAELEAELERHGGVITEGNEELALELRGAKDMVMEWTIWHFLTDYSCPICSLDQPIKFTDIEQIMHHILTEHGILLNQEDEYRRIVYGMLQLLLVYFRSLGTQELSRKVRQTRYQRRCDSLYRLNREYGIPMSRLAAYFEIDQAKLGKMTYNGLMNCHGCKDWMANSI